MTEPRSIFAADGANDDERLYFKMIDAAFTARNDRVISNGKPAHAVYLLHKFLDNAESNVKVLSGRLSRTFDGVLAYADPEMARAAIKFLRRRDSRLSILIADDIDVDPGQAAPDHPLLAAIERAEINGRVTVAKADAQDRDDFDHHFIVMDESASRVEFDTENAQAFVNLGDTGFASRLASAFDFFELNSVPLYSKPATS